jgi:hypothetical protein
MRTRREARREKTTTGRPPAGSDVPERAYTGENCSVCGHLQFATPSGVTCANGHGGAPATSQVVGSPADTNAGGGGWEEPPADAARRTVEEVSGELAKVLRVPPNPLEPQAPRRRPEPGVQRGASDVSALREDLGRVVETVWVDDIHDEWHKLEAELRLGDKRTEHAYAQRALERCAHNAYRAHRLYITAKRARDAWEAENEPVFAAMWTAATHALQAEKDQGVRSKQITDADVRARCATLFPDQWLAQEDRRRAIELTVKSLERLADIWQQNRSSDLKTYVAKMRG